MDSLDLSKIIEPNIVHKFDSVELLTFINLRCKRSDAFRRSFCIDEFIDLNLQQQQHFTNDRSLV